jgi:hypothetical protein
MPARVRLGIGWTVPNATLVTESGTRDGPGSLPVS